MKRRAGRRPGCDHHGVPGSAPPAARRAVIAAAVIASALATATTAAGADAPLLYLHEEAALAIDRGLGGGTLRQAPVMPNPRWPSTRTVGKVSGRELVGVGAAGIAATLRAGWRDTGGLVAVDEMTPAHWSPTSAATLAGALDRLGSDAGRVIFYASPSFVEQVGRADPRAPLPADLAALIDAVSRGRATYLQTYRGDLSPFPAREMATHPTRWAARWPAGRGELRAILGPDGGLGQAELWTRLRATPAGRDMLARGPAAYGLTSAAAARSWLDQYRAYRAAPSVAVAGADYSVPAPGGLTLTPSGTGRVRVQITRAGSAVVTMTPSRGGAARAIR